MSVPFDGGPAFPAESFAAQHAPGASLRDLVALHVLTAITENTHSLPWSWERRAEEAFRAADAFIAERGKFYREPGR